MKRITKRTLEIANLCVFHRNRYWDALGELEDRLGISIDGFGDFNALADYVDADDIRELIRENSKS